MDAVDGETLNPVLYENRLRQDLCYKRNQEYLTPSRIGCYLSHYNLWEEIVAAEIPHALILEDDVRWHDGFFETAQAVVDCDWRWDVVLLSHYKAARVEKKLCDLHGKYALVRYRRPGWTTAAYLITLTGARKLLKHCKRIDGSVDTKIREEWENGLALYDVTPPPAYQSGEASNIVHREGARTAAEQKQYTRMKNYRGFRRKLYHLLHPPRRK